jgi:hypothetical protein
MGADGSAYIVVGIGVTRTTFFAKTGEAYACVNGHPYKKAPPPFCSQCGKPVRALALETATPDFAAWAKSLDKEPDDVWEMLCEYEGGIDVGLERKDAKFYADLGVHHVAGIESSEREENHLALGYRLLDQDSDGRSGPNTYPVKDLAERAVFLTALAKELKVEFLLPVQLYLTFHWSV